MQVIKIFILLVSNLLFSATLLYAINIGDEVQVSPEKDSINVRSAPGANGVKLYQVFSLDRGMVIDGPIQIDGYEWFLIDWDDSQDKKENGWTATGYKWYLSTGKTFISQLEILHTLSETFFTNRPEKLDANSTLPKQAKISYYTNREQGFQSLDAANKNISKALAAVQNNDYVTANQQYKFAVVHLNNCKNYFDAAVENVTTN